MPAMRSFRWLLSPCLLLWFIPSLSAEIRANAKDTLTPLAVSIDDQRVIAAGGHPNGRILIVGYERVRGRYKETVARHRAYLSANDAGALTLTPRGGIASNSVWIGVDVHSGRYGVVSPGSAPLREIPLPEGSLKNDNNGQLKKLVSALPLAYFVLIRPGEGAWELTGGDGGKHDVDHSVDGKTELSLDDFQPLSDDLPEPKQFRKSDLLLVFSPDQVGFSVVRVGDK